MNPRQYRLRRHLWSRKLFWKLLARGFFPDGRVELVNGVIVRTPIHTNAHCISVEVTARALRATFGAEYLGPNARFA